jgi:site-specific recombinase XerD
MLQLIKNLKEELEGRNYSDKTVISYCNYCNNFLNWLGDKEMNEKNIKKYSLSLKKKYSTSTSKLNICAIRHMFINIMDKPELATFLPSIRQESRLPVVLSTGEVRRLINSALNDSHKTILMVLYSCGLRLEELLKIKIKDIDFDRKNILVHGKGKKDRFVPVEESVLNLINKNMGDLNPNDYFCTNIKRCREKSKRCMCRRTIAAIVSQCAERAKIKKRVYPHLLRHSVATHLIESGVDIRYIQVLLGHTSIMSTSTYTHIASIPNSISSSKFNYLFL